MPVGDPPLVQIIGADLDGHPVTRQDTDVMHPHLARDMGDHLMGILKLNFEHRIRQRLEHFPFKLEFVFLRHVFLSSVGKQIGTVFGNCNGMLVVGRWFAIKRRHRPAVSEHTHFAGS